ncbi:MAG: SIMPL domain-containing protein [Anaerolineae bacterium]
MFSKRGFVQVGMVVLLVATLLVTAGCTPRAGTVASGSVPITTGSDGTVKLVGVTGDTSNLRTISVNGTGQAFGTPDVAYVQLGVSTVNPDAATAVSQNSTAMAAVIAAVKAMGVEAKDIQTVMYSMWVEQVVDKDGVPTGMSRLHVENQIRVTLQDPSKTGELIGQAFSVGANTVSSISFAVLDTAAMQKQARDAAMAQVKERAQQLAEGFGARLGAVRQVNEYSSMPSAAPEVKGYGVRAYDSIGAPVETGQFVVTVDIQVTFDIAE